ncbi:MAG: serine/threonine protein kinase, partial [Planctomycetaceae bacterium]|nr:serine/threonine protein kinase [Planctomycetaceae bacterium]
HAHQKGIIHRDLKPNNILVTQQDDKPVPKVIDFGLVKATNQRLTEKTLFTTHGQVLGTLEYMGPEQAQLNDVDIDTRSDIYSLGVILYELLTGSTPLKHESLHKAGYMEILKRIKEEEPERPSLRISDSIDSLESISSVRQVEPRKLSTIVKGDLDWIVLKAMEKNRSRRYETANGLASDIRRYLTDEPMEARPPSAGYRLQKLIRKNRVAFGFAATVTLLLLVGICVSSYLAFWATSEAYAARMASQRADEERDKAIQAQTEAETSARRMTAVLEIVTESFQSVDPTLGADAYDMPASDVLKRAYAQLDTRLADDPLARAALLSTLSRSFLGLGEIKMSLSAAEEAVRIRTVELGEQNPETLSSMHDLFRAYKLSGDINLAIEQGTRTVELRREILGEGHPETLASMISLAHTYIAKDDLDKSIFLQEE